ncbi:MAG: hypothetical protein V3S36_06780, partial [Acidiferrobacterales bacterium]
SVTDESMPIKTWRGAMAASADIASFTAEIPEFTDDYTDVGARVTHGAVTDDYTDVGARVTHGAVTDDYMDVRLQGWRTTAGTQEVEQRREHDYTDVGARVTPGAVTALPS